MNQNRTLNQNPTNQIPASENADNPHIVHKPNFIGMTYRKHDRMRGFMFVDVKSHVGEPIFIHHRLKVYFAGQYTNDTEYVCILCQIHKKDVGTFFACMKELKNTMLLRGYTDYENISWSLVQNILTHQFGE